MKKHISSYILIVCCFGWIGCSKQSTKPVYSVASLNVVNALPNSAPLILAQGSISSAIGNFLNIDPLSYGSTAVLTPMSGMETIYAVQSNEDTATVGGKAPAYMFNSELRFARGGLYSLFLTGVDTTNPDYLFVQDTLPVIVDSTVGIRFVNLSAGSSPVSINLEGSSIGSEVSSLPYKGITEFRQFINNSTTIDYLFVVRDAATGDSLTQFDFLAAGSYNGGNGLTDPSSGHLLTFKNVTIALYGSQNNPNAPLNMLLIDNY